MLFGAGHIGRQMVSAKKLGPIAPDANSPTLVLDLMTPGTLDPRITFTRTTTATYYDSTGAIQTAAINVPRWDYHPGTLALCGLLLEEARTNNALQSGDFTNAAWVKGGCTLAAGTLGPNGAVTGSGLIGNAGATGYLGSGTFTPAVGTTYTLSCFMKAGSHTSALFLMPAAWFANALSRTVTFNLATGTVSAVGGATASGAITPAGNGWYRCSMTATPDTAVAAGYQIGRTAAVGDGVALQHYVWGAQFEVGSYVTSYIPTTTVAVTRARDALSVPVGTWYDATKGSASLAFILRGSTPLAYAAFAGFYGVSADTDGISVAETNGDASATQPTVYGAEIAAGDALVTDISFAAPPPAFSDLVHKTATAWAANSYMRMAFNGNDATVQSAGPQTLTPTVTRLLIAPAARHQAQLSLWARQFTYWPRQLSQAELTLTSIGAM